MTADPGAARNTMSRKLRATMASVIVATAGMLLIAAPTLSVSADEKAGEAELGATLVAKLKRARPDIPITGVSESPVAGVLTIELEGGQSVYGTADGKYLFAGDLYAIGADLTNLAEVKREAYRKDLLAGVSVEDTWVFKPTGATKAVINVFTDIDCGYCRKLHQEVPELNRMGVEVRYLAFPRAGVGSESYNTIVSAWCASDRSKALTDAKAGRQIKTSKCVNPVADQYELGGLVGVTGTPAIVTEAGKLLPGYMPANALGATLGL
ncbi:MAG: thioredoxin fold domain-containing protein [Pseudomonadota bacterium]